MNNSLFIQNLIDPIEFQVMSKIIPQKGNLVYEYNPFRNLRLTENKYEYNDLLYTQKELKEQFDIDYGYSFYNEGSHYTYRDESLFEEELNKQIEKGIITEITEEGLSTTYNINRDLESYPGWEESLPTTALTQEKLFDLWDYLIKKNKKLWKWYKGKEIITENQPQLYERGTLVDFITDQLQFKLDHPVDIIPQYSYDGSVNLILNDGLNTPKLINSRFSATGKNTYEIIDRKGNDDTNIYDEGGQFDTDTSLYKVVNSIPQIEYLGTSLGGNLSIGNYHFYFRLADADGNETDFIAESGLVSVFLGDGNPRSISTGIKNENSHKLIKFKLLYLDPSYNYINVYYSRYTAEAGENFSTEYKKINKKYNISTSGISNIIITGFEEVDSISSSDINVHYNIVDFAKTQASCQEMLFLGNVHKPNISYKELQDLSLHFLPYLKQEVYQLDIDQEYSIKSSTLGYYSDKFIYDKVGYWNEELYRIGVVYILPNGELTPVFNIRGATNIYLNKSDKTEQTFSYTNFPIYNENGERVYVDYDTNTNYVIQGTQQVSAINENVMGVIRIKSPEDTNIIYSLDIRIDEDSIQELKKYVKGYFFVRQERMPLILAQGITIGIDQVSRTPTIPTSEGFLHNLQNALDYTHVQTENINGVNYISEGFLTRYQYKLKKKKIRLFKKILKAIAIGIGIVAVAAASIFTGGAALAGGVGIVGAMNAGAAAIGTIAGTAAGATGIGTAGTILVSAGVLGAAAGLGVTIAGITQEIRYSVSRNFETVKIDGRNSSIPSGYTIEETEVSRKLDNNYINRLIIKDSTKNKVQAILCPDYEVNQAFYNQIFSGNSHKIGLTISQSTNGLNGFGSNYFTNSNRHFYIPKYYDMNVRNQYTFNVVGVPDGTPCVGLGDLLFRSRAGEAEEAYRYEFIGESFESDNRNKKICGDLVRGNFGPYLAINDTLSKFSPAETVNIYISGYSEDQLQNYISIRMNDHSSYKAISDRYDINHLDDYRLTKKSSLVQDSIQNIGYKHEVYRGDCYICQFTHRVNRNFNDPSAPYNDKIVDPDSWKNNFDPDKSENYANINLGDVNAVQLGMWVTFTVRSSNNLNIRTLDSSNVDEEAMCGHSRGYYPYFPMSVEGSYKILDSQIYNKGFTKSLGERWNSLVPDVPYIKNWFGTRIMYSDVHINDAYKNGFRTFQGTHYRDYTREYGEIVKLISLQSNLLCVFEHGVALIPINERAVAGEGAGGNIYINTSNVLPENPKIISDMFGSQWPESILKVPGRTGDSAQYVYGVDTVAKKIWRTDGNTFTCISDFRVQEFLNKNITLGERELTPKIGIRNVKTVYNAFKRDVLFTFYDNTYGFEEKVWNLCWNELLQKFITFYSWVPSHMENINNIPFSFDRNTAKWLAKLGTSHSENSFADGITLSNVIVDSFKPGTVIKVNTPYLDICGQWKIFENLIMVPSGYVGVLSLSNRMLPNPALQYTISYYLERDQHGNHNNFNIARIVGGKYPQDAVLAGKPIITYVLYITDYDNLLSELYYRNKEGNKHSDDEANKIAVGDTITKKVIIDGKEEQVQKVITLQEIVENNYPIFKDKTGKRPTLPRDKMINPDKIVQLLNIKAKINIRDDANESKLSDDYYNIKAGYESGTSLIDAGYYESTVAVIPRWNMQFLSTDFWKHGQAGLIDIADTIYPTYWYGKQHPFEFECIVVNDPSIHKIFTNLELVANKAKPESFHYEIIGEAYDFAKDKANMYFRQEAMKALWQYNGADISYNRNFLNVQTRQQSKSADFPHRYYTRQDTINDIEDYYIHITYPKGHDYNHLSGAEIVYYPTRQEYRIWNHAKAVSLDDLSQDDSRSIIAANCQYLEDRWKVTINPILVCYKNEYQRKDSGALIKPENSTWADSYDGQSKLPPLPIYNSPIPDKVLEKGIIKFPGVDGEKSENALYELYDTRNFGQNENWKPLDLTNWLNDVDIYKYNFGEAQNRKEIDLKDKFLKIRIRYSGEELAVIDFLNTVYRISYS